MWRIASTIYYGNYHYIMRHIDSKGRVWLYDSMQNRGAGQLERGVSTEDTKYLLQVEHPSGHLYKLTMSIFVRIS